MRLRIGLIGSFILAATLMLFTASCDKDDNGDDKKNGNDNIPPATLSCKVNGTEFIATVVKIRWVALAGGVDKIGCEAVDSAGNSLSFVVVAEEPGTYSVKSSDHGTSSMDFTFSPAGSNFFAGFAGFNNTATVTFSKVENYDKNNMLISGSFEFTVSGSNLPDSPYSITKGVFENVRW
jgi:hypothetical protein